MDFIRRYSNRVLLVGLVLWFIAGFFPMTYYGQNALDKAGQFGDSFGAATSLFTGVSFVFALLALVMQIQESKESGERQLKQEQLELRQVELQAEQAKIAERTAQLQESIRKDAQRESALQVLRKVYADAIHYERAIVQYAGVRMKHPESGPLIEETARLNQAESQLLSNRFTLELLFGEMGAVDVNARIDKLVAVKGSWPELVKGGAVTLELHGRVDNIRQALHPLWKKVAA